MSNGGRELRIVESDTAQSILEIQGVEFSERGLRIDRALSFPDWEAMLVALRRINQGIQWAIGDALNYGEARFGEMYAQAIDITGYSYSHLSAMKWVSGVFPPERRRLSLEWDKHKAVCRLFSHNPAAAEEIMDMAEDNGMPSREMRNDAREALAAMGIVDDAMPSGVMVGGRSHSLAPVGISSSASSPTISIFDRPERSADDEGDEDYGQDRGYTEGEWLPLDDDDHQGVRALAVARPRPYLLNGAATQLEELTDLVLRFAASPPDGWKALHDEAVRWAHDNNFSEELQSEE